MVLDSASDSAGERLGLRNYHLKDFSDMVHLDCAAILLRHFGDEL